jgi:hypothetical protein
LSLVTRLVGFGLCLFGAYMVGYFQALHTTAGIVSSTVTQYAGSTPDFNTAILAQVVTYLQQNAPSAWGSYVAIGVVIAIGGAVLVAVGDRKLTGAKR